MSKPLTRRLTPCRYLLPLSLLLFVIHCSLFTTFGQSSTATLSGTVEDANGQIIPNAAVTLTDPAKGLRRTAATNDSGYFTFVLLPASTYTLLVEQTGFGRAQFENIVLNVGDQKALKVELKVGDVTAQIEVRPDETLVRTDGSVGTVVDRQFVANIPLNGRSFQSLLDLTPGIVFVPAAAGGGQFSVNGQRPNTNNFTVDGVSANTAINSTASGFVGQAGSGQLPGLTASGTTASLVSADALQEFRIQTSSFAPEFGPMPGGQISLITRSGTNDFHGSVYDYVRNEAFDANDWFVNSRPLTASQVAAGLTKQPRSPLRQHLFGGAFSGPLYLPSFGEGVEPIWSGKDRTFFFFSYEGLRLLQPRSAQVTVPNVATRNNAPAAYRPFLNALPIPNGPDVSGLPVGRALFFGSWSDPSAYDATAVRVDHTVGGLTVFGRFSYTPSSAKERVGTLSNVRSSNQKNRAITFGATWQMSKHLLNDLRVNFTDNFAPFRFEQDDFGGAVPLTNFGFRGRGTENATFSFAIQEGGGLQWGSQTSFKQRQLNIVDGLTVLYGEHQLKVGGNFRRTDPLLNAGAGGTETVTFNYANFTPGSPTIGRAVRYVMTVRDPERRAVAFDNLSLYAQDTWKVNTRFTLTYGVRWELVPPPSPTEGGNAVTLENLDNPFGGQVHLAPRDTPLWTTHYNNFAPRFGVSFLLRQKSGSELVLRGGGGVFHDLGFENIANAFGHNYPFQALRSFPLSTDPDPNCRAPLAFPLPPCALIDPRLGVDPPQTLWVMDRNLKLPFTYQWNISAEQSIGNDQTITVSFVGAEGKRLIKEESYQIPLLDWGSAPRFVLVGRNGGRSDYRSLQVQYQRRLSRGFQSLISYTLGRSRDTASAGGDYGVPSANLSDDSNYGYSAFDIRHVLTGAFTFQLPKLKRGSLLKALTSNWGLDLMFRARSGAPLNINTLMQFPGDPNTYLVLPNLISGVPIYVDDPLAPGGRRLNNTIPSNSQIAAAGCAPVAALTPALGAFCTPVATQGNFPRGSVRGFVSRQIDVSLRRELRLRESLRIQLRFEAFNVLNMPNFSDPNGSMLSGTFGRSTNTLNRSLGGLNALYQIGGPRSLQGAIKILF